MTKSNILSSSEIGGSNMENIIEAEVGEVYGYFNGKWLKAKHSRTEGDKKHIKQSKKRILMKDISWE
ncbi:hypothetical protein FACS1894113_2650 [Alphaproteobacteria bacterium]|nr:hypothetical protein FACS1894113_2650 [Alphaproteobacteria bacterium]